MSVKLPGGLRADELRILQEFRRLGRREMARTDIQAIRHPAGGGPEAIEGLLTKGYLSKTQEDVFVLDAKADELFAFQPMPYYERG